MGRFVCQKCNGTGKVEHFSHIASGECFACGGTGRYRMTADAKAKIGQLADTVRTKANWILNATVDDVSRMTWTQLDAARNFCHRNIPGYPSLLAIWNEIGEEAFQQEQSRKLDEWIANGGW